MKNIKDFITESDSDMPKKEKDQLELIVSSLVEGYYSDGADDMEEFVKEKLKDSRWPEEDIKNLISICKVTLKETEKKLGKLSKK